MRLKVQFEVEIKGWVTVERDVPDLEAFDAARGDEHGTREHRLLDSMADESLQLAFEQLDGEVYGTRIVAVTP